MSAIISVQIIRDLDRPLKVTRVDHRPVMQIRQLDNAESVERFRELAINLWRSTAIMRLESATPPSRPMQ